MNAALEAAQRLWGRRSNEKGGQPGRELKAQRRVVTHKPKVRYLGDYWYLVESRTRPDVWYTVNTLKLRCTCEAGKHYRRCWHLVFCLDLEQWREKQKLGG